MSHAGSSRLSRSASFSESEARTPKGKGKQKGKGSGKQRRVKDDVSEVSPDDSVSNVDDKKK